MTSLEFHYKKAAVSIDSHAPGVDDSDSCIRRLAGQKGATSVKHRSLLCTFAIIIWCSAARAAKIQATCAKAAHFLGQRQSQPECSSFLIDVADNPIEVPRVLSVPNASRLTVIARHLISQTCNVNFKAASITTSTNPIAGLLSTFAGAKVTVSTGQIGFVELVKPAVCSEGLRTTPTDNVAQAIQQRLHSLDRSLAEGISSANDIGRQTVFTDILNLAYCKPVGVCASDRAFADKRQQLQNTLAVTKQHLSNLQATLDSLKSDADKARTEFSARKLSRCTSHNVEPGDLEPGTDGTFPVPKSRAQRGSLCMNWRREWDSFSPFWMFMV